jgi:hypothetical protein
MADEAAELKREIWLAEVIRQAILKHGDDTVCAVGEPGAEADDQTLIDGLVNLRLVAREVYAALRGAGA